MSNKELEEIDYTDILVDFHSQLETYGARKVLYDFRHAFPAMFQEITVQIGRLDLDKTIPSLLKPDARPM